MEAKECKVQDILTENKKFIIPSYQRPYSWTVDNAEQLIDDIYKSSQSEENEYFIGSMICINKGQNHIFHTAQALEPYPLKFRSYRRTGRRPPPAPR